MCVMCCSATSPYTIDMLRHMRLLPDEVQDGDSDIIGGQEKRRRLCWHLALPTSANQYFYTGVVLELRWHLGMAYKKKTLFLDLYLTLCHQWEW